MQIWLQSAFLSLQTEFEEEYDIVQKIGEGWYSRVYLTEHRATRHEFVLKAINSKNMSTDEFLREFHHSLLLATHKNIITAFPDMVFSIGNCHLAKVWLTEASLKLFLLSWLILEQTFWSRMVIFSGLLLRAQVVQERFYNGAAHYNSAVIEWNTIIFEDRA